jgi:hypothetical protein
MSFAKRQRTSYLAVAAAVALALSACSSGTPASTTITKATASSTAPTGNSAAALLQRSRISATTAKSVHIKGTVKNGASGASKAVTARIDLASDLAGKNYLVLVNDGTGVVEMLTAGGKTYRKADTAYWTKNYSAAVAKALAGKYTLLSAASAAATGTPTVRGLLNQIYASATGQLSTKVVRTEVNGVPAYLLTSKANDTKIYVSADPKALLLRVEGSRGQLTAWDFTEWNAVPPVRAPAAAQLNKPPSK